MPFVLCEIKNAVAVITLNRPEKFNALNGEMALQLQQILKDCARDKYIRSLYITGNGKAFCAGQDLEELTTEKAPDTDKILKEHFNPVVSLIRDMEKPVVCAVNGVAAGAGANIALCCDVVVAAASASFIQAFSKIGLIPDSGGTYTLPRLIGFQKASAIMMMGDKIPAAEAERLGMIYKAIPDEHFLSESVAIAETLARMPTKGLALTKKALQASMNNTWEQQLQTEHDLQHHAGQTSDYREGVSAFLEKRAPLFRGE